MEILIDSWGVPHIYASSTYDAFFAQGFNAARDRLWQIDLWRKATGRATGFPVHVCYLVHQEFLQKNPAIADELLIAHADAPRSHDAPLALAHADEPNGAAFARRVRPSAPTGSTWCTSTSPTATACSPGAATSRKRPRSCSACSHFCSFPSSWC